MPLTLDIASLFIGAGVGAIISFLGLRLLYSKHLTGNDKAEATIRLEMIEKQNSDLLEEKEVLEQRVDDLQYTNAELHSTLKHERASLEEKLQLIEKTKEQMTDTFKAISQEALNTNQESFLNLAKERLQVFQNDAKNDLEKRHSAIKELVNPVTKSLEKMDEKIVDLEKTRHNAYGELREHMKHMKGDQNKLRQETASLVQALRSPSTRGQWGELQLKRTLEMAGMVEGVHFEQQVSVDSDDGRQRPDVIVKLPGGQSIIIDAKAPIEAYLNSLKENIDETERCNELKRHARHVREHMKSLSSKTYWEKFNSPEFIVMFLPGESYFSAALEHDPSLLEAGVDHKVIPASPTTLISLLKAVSYGWKQEKMAENAQEISNIGKELYKRLSAFGDHMQRVGKGLNTAMNSYNSAVGSLERSVLPSARKFEELHAAPAGKTIPTPDPLEQMPRVITAPELLESTEDSEKGKSKKEKKKA